MNVIVNLQPLLTPLTGIGYYTRELTLELLARADGTDASRKLHLEGLTGTRLDPLTAQYPLLASPTEGNRETPRARPRLEHGKLWRLARRYLRNPVTCRAYRWLYSRRLGRHMQGPLSGGGRLYWEPNYILLPWKGASVITVHDLSHERHPEFHPHERVDFFNRHLLESLARATRINVVSQFTARELQALHDIDPARIDIVPPGVSSRFFAAAGVSPGPQLVERYRLPLRFLLSVGTLEPRKNLSRILRAFASLPLADQQDAPLLLVGMQGWSEHDMDGDVRRAMQAGTIRRLGYVPGSEMPALYAAASGFIYVSQYEGFGMPVIEAMAAATPVLTANVTATAEVAGQAALQADPWDIDAIRDGMRALLSDDATQRVQAGRVRAAEFTWPAAADRLLASFDHALNG